MILIIIWHMILRILHMMLGSNINIACDIEKNAHDVERLYFLTVKQ